jgi:hypothetical protein
MVLMSKANNPPTISDTTIPASNSSDRSAAISGDAGATYHIRVCKISGGVCTVYSDVVDFIFGKITLVGFTDINSGNATVSWTNGGVFFRNGYKILASTSNASPTISDTVATIASSGANSGDFTGTAGTTYHVRVCEYDGISACILYSDTKDFTFAKITLTSLSETAEGEADLEWTANGDFTNGFIWLASSYTKEPILSDPDTQSGPLSGSDRSTGFTLTAGMTHYFRLCQANSSGGCAVYSNVLSAYFSSSLVLTGSATGSSVTLTWTGPSGYSDFDQYIILGSLDVDPAIELGTVAKATKTYTYTVTGSGLYGYYICAYDSATSTCHGYSNYFTINVTP